MTIELLTVKEVAAILKCSTDTVFRRFKDRKGTIDLGEGRYRVLRIPRNEVDRYIEENMR